MFLASYFAPLKIWPIITARSIFPHLKAEPIHQKSVFKFILFGFISSEVKNAVNLSTFSEFPVKQKFKAFLFLKSSYLFVCLSWGETNTSGNCLLIYSYFGGQECRPFVYIIGNFQSSRHSKYRLSLWIPVCAVQIPMILQTKVLVGLKVSITLGIFFDANYIHDDDPAMFA